MKALADFGFADLGISKDDLLTSGMVVQLGYPPEQDRLDQFA